jgi:hypothetical protein
MSFWYGIFFWYLLHMWLVLLELPEFGNRLWVHTISFYSSRILMLWKLTYLWQLSSILKHLYVSIVSLRGGRLPFSDIYVLWWPLFFFLFFSFLYIFFFFVVVTTILESHFFYLLWATTHTLIQIHLQNDVFSCGSHGWMNQWST